MTTYQILGQAKQKLNDIFLGIQKYGDTAYLHLADLNMTCPDMIDENKLMLLSDYLCKVEEIHNEFICAQMKVVFFGRKSSGKSTVINAMLGENVLPSSFGGHATNAFLQVEGSHIGNAYLNTKGILPIHYNVQSAPHLAYILKNNIKLNEKELIHVYWPIENCRLLKEDVALIEIPGIDTTPYLDQWIYTHCINADAFVLVVDAESALMEIEMNFIRKISETLPNSNIFILINCWDKSEFFDQELKQQKMRHIKDLLENVCTTYEPRFRTFLISAKEVLQFREVAPKGLQTTIDPLYMYRYLEFLQFESQLEECISRSALLKISNYAIQGSFLLSGIIIQISNIKSREQTYLTMIWENEIQDEFNVTEEQLTIVTNTNSPTTVVDDSFSFDNYLDMEQNLPSISHVLAVGTQCVAAFGGIVLARFMINTVGWRWMIAGAIYLYKYLSNFVQSSQLLDELAQLPHNAYELAVNYDNFEPNILFNSADETTEFFALDKLIWLKEDLVQLHSYLVDISL